MWLPFLVLAIPISLADLKSFTIPNVYLVILSLLCAPYVFFNGLGQISVVLAALFILLMLNVLGLGMGDVKLLSIILFTLNSDDRNELTLLAVLIILSASLHVMWRTLKNRSLPRRIPLAPSIFVGLALYLATQ
jgi:Flp pilus assembly protein protease CpaA